MIFIFDCITVPDVLTSANAKYLLSGDTVASSAIVLDRYVLNSSFPFESYVAITDLCVVPVNITATYPSLFTSILETLPSTSFSHKILESEIR